MRAIFVLCSALLIGLIASWFRANRPLPEVDPRQIEIFQAISDSLARIEQTRSSRSGISRVEQSQSPAEMQIPLNTATVQELQMAPGIGPVIAQRIIKYRQEHGRFRQIEQLLQVKGIGEKTLRRIRPYLAVDE